MVKGQGLFKLKMGPKRIERDDLFFFFFSFRSGKKEEERKEQRLGVVPWPEESSSCSHGVHRHLVSVGKD